MTKTGIAVGDTVELVSFDDLHFTASVQNRFFKGIRGTVQRMMGTQVYVTLEDEMGEFHIWIDPSRLNKIPLSLTFKPSYNVGDVVKLTMEDKYIRDRGYNINDTGKVVSIGCRLVILEMDKTGRLFHMPKDKVNKVHKPDLEEQLLARTTDTFQKQGRAERPDEELLLLLLNG